MKSVEALNLGPVIETEFDDGKYEMTVRGVDDKKIKFEVDRVSGTIQPSD